MNIQIYPEYPDQIPELELRLHGLSGRMRGLVSVIMAQAVEAGRKVAEAEAPRAHQFTREGRRIVDSIQVDRSGLQVGGAGGGSAYTVYRLFASNTIAPQLEYVMEGTADHGEGKIYPSRGNVLAIQKEGEPVRFRPWVHGQEAQTGWWHHAHETVQAYIDEGMRNLDLGS